MKHLKRTFALLVVVFAFMLIANPVNAEAATPKLNKKKLKMIVGDIKELKVKNTKKKVKWSSSDEDVVIVDQGFVVANEEGTAVITAKVGKKKLTCKITVKEKPQLDKKLTICVGSKSYLEVTGTSKKPKWKSSNPKVVKINKKGAITGKKLGKATITAKVGEKTLKCKITVKKAVTVAKTAINIENGGVLPVKYNSYFVYASSADTSIAKVGVVDGGNGEALLKVYGVKDGTTTITITNDCNKETVKVTVTVKKPEAVGAQQLINYLIQNGEVGEDGFIGIIEEDEMLMVMSAILYDAETDTISFADVKATGDDTSATASMIDLAYDYHSKKVAVVLMDMDVSMEGFDMESCMAEIEDVSTYDRSDLEFVDIFTEEKLSSDEQISANATMRELLVKMEGFMNSKTGYIFADIGLAGFSQAE